ncbi:MAG: hypothetical protein GY946_30485 [bacterium]|nr:hypothetical protein [bacterium]
MLRRILNMAFIGLLAATSAVGEGTDQLSAEAARQDILQPGSALERVHLDPYSGFGGRVKYQWAFQALLDDLPESRIPVTELRWRIALFLGELGNGHTYIEKLPNASGELPYRFLPVRFATSSDGLFSSDTTPTFGELRGASNEAVAGLSPAKLSHGRISGSYPRTSRRDGGSWRRAVGRRALQPSLRAMPTGQATYDAKSVSECMRDLLPTGETLVNENASDENLSRWW